MPQDLEYLSEYQCTHQLTKNGNSWEVIPLK